MRTIDLSIKHFGHDYIFDPIEGGLRGSMTGWCTPRPSEGDYLILKNGDFTTRYQVESIKYTIDPDDMWFAKVKFAPRG